MPIANAIKPLMTLKKTIWLDKTWKKRESILQFTVTFNNLYINQSTDPYLIYIQEHTLWCSCFTSSHFFHEHPENKADGSTASGFRRIIVKLQVHGTSHCIELLTGTTIQSSTWEVNLWFPFIPWKVRGTISFKITLRIWLKDKVLLFWNLSNLSDLLSKCNAYYSFRLQISLGIWNVVWWDWWEAIRDKFSLKRGIIGSLW